MADRPHRFVDARPLAFAIAFATPHKGYAVTFSTKEAEAFFADGFLKNKNLRRVVAWDAKQQLHLLDNAGMLDSDALRDGDVSFVDAQTVARMVTPTDTPSDSITFKTVAKRFFACDGSLETTIRETASYVKRTVTKQLYAVIEAHGTTLTEIDQKIHDGEPLEDGIREAYAKMRD